VLGIPEVRNAGASGARGADIVVVSVSGHTELPGTIRVWLDMWLLLLRRKKPDLVLSCLNNAAELNTSCEHF
jgi:hypothetical protein